MWLDDQVLACAQVDLIGAIFDAELALSAAQVIARRDAKAGKQSHMVASSPAARAALAKPEVWSYACATITFLCHHCRRSWQL